MPITCSSASKKYCIWNDLLKLKPTAESQSDQCMHP